MKHTRVVRLVLVWLVGVLLTNHTLSQAIAQSAEYHLDTLGVLSETDNSVTKVMQKAGCDFNWLSKVVGDSNINPNNLRRLPVGQAVVIESGLCKTTPPQSVTNLSRVIFSIDANRSNLISSDLEQKLEAVEKERDNTAAENKDLGNRITTLEAQKSVLETDLATAKAASVAKGSVNPFYAVLLVVIGTLFGWGFTYWKAREDKKEFERKMVSYPREESITEGDTKYFFLYSGAVEDNGEIVPKYKCPTCNERNISAHNLARHMATHLATKKETVKSTTTEGPVTARVTRSEQRTSSVG